MKIDRFIQRVALIVGISAGALAAAVKDGRATLPPSTARALSLRVHIRQATF